MKLFLKHLARQVKETTVQALKNAAITKSRLTSWNAEYSYIFLRI